MCMSSGGECRVLVEVMLGYSPEEERQLIASTTGALQAIDQFTGGKAADIFTGLHIKIGEDIAEGGAKAAAEENQVLLNGRKMLLSVAEMRQVSGAYSDEELAGFPDEQRPGGALEYTLVHEIGHVLDGQTKAGEVYHRVAASESPTKYGREADEWHSDNKDHEAFAEGFAHAVYGMSVSKTMEVAVRETIGARLQEIAENQAEAREHTTANSHEVEVEPETDAEKIKQHLEDYFGSDIFALQVEQAARGDFERKSEFIGDLIQYSVLFPDVTTSELEKYADSQVSNYTDARNGEYGLNRHFLDERQAEYITEQAARVLGIEPDEIEARKEDIAKYIFERWTVNGYVFHGFNSSAEESIREHGLSGEKRNWDNGDIGEIDGLFARYGVERITGWHTLNSEGVFFVSETPTASYSYAARSPEWFSSFVGGSLNYAGIRRGGHVFTDRNYAEAVYNIQTLMEKANFSEEDRKQALGFFNKYWSDLASDTMPQLALIERSAVDSHRNNDFALTYKIVTDRWNDREPEKTAAQIVRSILALDRNPDRNIKHEVLPNAITIVNLPK